MWARSRARTALASSVVPSASALSAVSTIWWACSAAAAAVARALDSSSPLSSRCFVAAPSAASAVSARVRSEVTSSVSCRDEGAPRLRHLRAIRRRVHGLLGGRVDAHLWMGRAARGSGEKEGHGRGS